MNILLVILGGLIGGALRGLIGIAKGLVTKEEEKINYKYFFVSLAVSGLVGLVAALMLPVDFKFALLAGYAGSDFLETLYCMPPISTMAYMKNESLLDICHFNKSLLI